MRPWQALARLVVLLLALAALLVAPRAARGAEGQRAILTLFVNQVQKDEIVVTLRDGDVLVSLADLEAAGLHDLGAKPAGGRVSLASIRALKFTVDEAALALRIEAPVRMLATTVVRFSPSAPAGMELRRDTSAFVNYAVRAGYPLALDTFFDAGLSIEGNLLSTTLSVGSQLGVVRGLTSFTVDDRQNLRRWIVGDAFVSGGALGAGVFLGGFGVQKSFAIDPYFVRTPSLGYSGSTLTPATLDVYVNGVLVKSQSLAPGPFQVQNVQVPSGAGEIRYVVRDVFGRQDAVSSPYYASGTALAPGLSEYTYTVGAVRTNVGSESFGYHTAGALLRHRYGVNNRVTLGGRFEVAPGLVSGGPSLTLTLPVGQIDLELAASAATEGSGAAALLSYSYLGRRFGGGVVARVVSERYATLGLAPSDDRELMRVNAFTTVAVTSKLSLGAQYLFAIDRDLGASYRVGFTGNAQLSRRLGLTLGVARGAVPGSAPAFDVFAGLTLVFDGGVNASVGGRYGGTAREAYAEVNKPPPVGNGFGYRLYGVASEAPTATGAVQYQGPYGRYQLTAQAGGESGASAALEAAGALAWVRGGGVVATRPVQDGFALVRVPDTPGVRVLLDNHELGRTNGRGEVGLPKLLPYYGNRISVADTDLPLEMAIDTRERIVAPPLRGGALIVFPAKRTPFLRGRVVLVDGEREIVPAFGEISARGRLGESSSPLGEHGEFELADLGPGAHEAQIKHEKRTCSFTLRAPQGARFILDVGRQRCVMNK